MSTSIDARLKKAEEHTDPEGLEYSLEALVLASYGEPLGEPTAKREPGKPTLEELILAAAVAP